MISSKTIINLCVFLAFMVIFSCSQRLTWYSKKRNQIVSYDHINDSTLSIAKVSDDPEFGYVASKPVMLGIYDVHDGAKNIKKYLNALQGEKGESVSYSRLKPCCPFRTKNFTYNMLIPVKGLIEYDGKHGMLEKYKLEYGDSLNRKSFILFFNLYDETKELAAPQGFTFRKK